MWVLKHRRIISKESEKCRGIDDRRVRGKHDGDLEVEPEVEELAEEPEDDGEEDDYDFVEGDLDEILAPDEAERDDEWTAEWADGQVPLGL